MSAPVRPDQRPDLKAVRPAPLVDAAPTASAAQVAVAPPTGVPPVVTQQVSPPTAAVVSKPIAAKLSIAPVLPTAPVTSSAMLAVPPPVAAPSLTAPAAVPQAAAPTASRPQSGKPTVQGPPQPASIDRGLLEQYGLKLSREIGKDQRYPRRAQMLGWTGTTQVMVRMSADGRVKEVSVAKSSGHEILDEEAVEKVKRARQLPQPPEDFRGREFTVMVPIVFRLE